jgi:hypothetical protein
VYTQCVLFTSIRITVSGLIACLSYIPYLFCCDEGVDVLVFSFLVYFIVFDDS